MNLARAKTLKHGSLVHCPADNGEPGYSGIVRHVSGEATHALLKEPFLWVSVEKDGKTRHVWPSNRLG